MPRLYDTCRELDVLINIDYGNSVNPETGEILSFEEVEKLKLEKDRLLKYFCGIHRDNKADIKKFDDEIARLTKKRNAIKNYDKSIVDYVTLCLNGEKWKQDGFSVYYMPGRESVVVPEDVNTIKELPAVYVATFYVPKKQEILAALKRGEKIEGCFIKVGSPATVIR